MLRSKTERMDSSSKFKEYEQLAKQALVDKDLSKSEWNQIDLSESTEAEFGQNVTTTTKPNSDLNESDDSSGSESNGPNEENLATQKSKPNWNEMDNVTETKESFEAAINKLLNENIFSSESKESIEDITIIKPKIN